MPVLKVKNNGEWQDTFGISSHTHQTDDITNFPDSLPNPHKITFTGSATGEYDGSAPLEVEIPFGTSGITPHIGDNGNWWIGEEDTGVRAEGEQGPQGVSGVYVGSEAPTDESVKVWINPAGDPIDIPTGGGSGGGDNCGYTKWVEVVNMTTEEDLGELIVNTDNDGNAFAFDELDCYIHFVGSAANTKQDNVEYRALYSNYASKRGCQLHLPYGQRITGTIDYHIHSINYMSGCSTHTAINYNDRTPVCGMNLILGKLTGIRLWPHSEYIAKDTTIVIYGRNREG